ncbi:hypothetical protein GOP47_0027561 [Adiantum capillus-veneris]|nr:hypothetical protein GOP47_0027561 [Adiantum capillus-veneris]
MLQINQMWDGWFNRFKGFKCKTLLKLASSRIKLLKNKRGIQLKQLRKELAHLLENGQESTACIRVEHIIREQNIMDAYEILEHFCELLIVRMPIVEIQRECPLDLKEAVASLIFAAPRASDLPELLEVQTLMSFKYGREFVASATELRPDCGVNRMIIEKLSARAPTARVKLDAMQEIAQEFNVEWDSTITELEFSKTQQDLLEPNEFIGPIQMSPIPFYEGDSHLQESTSTSHDKGEEIVLPSPSVVADDPKEPKFVPFGLPAPQDGMEALPNRFYSPPRESSITQQSELLEETLSQRSHARTKSEGSMNWQDYIEAAESAEAAAESAEKAAQAARAAAELCRSQVSPTAKGTLQGDSIPQSTNSVVLSSTVLKGGPIPDDYDWTQEYEGGRQQQNGNFHSEMMDTSNGYENMHNTHLTQDDYDWTVESYTKKPEMDHVFSSHEHVPEKDSYILYGEADDFSFEKPASPLRKEVENIFTFPQEHIEHDHHRPVYDAPRFDGFETVTASEPFRRQASLEDDPYYTYPNLFSKPSSG